MNTYHLLECLTSSGTAEPSNGSLHAGEAETINSPLHSPNLVLKRTPEESLAFWSKLESDAGKGCSSSSRCRCTHHQDMKACQK